MSMKIVRQDRKSGRKGKERARIEKWKGESEASTVKQKEKTWRRRKEERHQAYGKKKKDSIKNYILSK